MDIESINISAGGKLYHNQLQQHWVDNEVECIAIFAGQIMQLGECEDGKEGFELTYLGFKSNVFKNQEVAKLAATTFAVTVLEKMIGMIK